MTVQPGFHDFDLGSPPDYVPPTQTVNVVNTSSPNPLQVLFAPVVMGAPGPTAMGSRSRAAKGAARRRKAGAPKKKAKAAKPARKAARRPPARRKAKAAKGRTRKRAPS